MALVNLSTIKRDKVVSIGLKNSVCLVLFYFDINNVSKQSSTMYCSAHHVKDFSTHQLQCKNIAKKFAGSDTSAKMFITMKALAYLIFLGFVSK